MRDKIEIGFYFPDETVLHTEGVGHSLAAYRYIDKIGMREEYEKALEKNDRVYSEEDFVLFKMGAVKIYAQRGKKYAYMPRSHNYYISSLKKKCKAQGIIILYYNSMLGPQIDDFCGQHIVNVYPRGISYSRTVVIHNGILQYNPVHPDGD